MHPERNCGHVAFWHLADTERCPVLRGLCCKTLVETIDDP
jgi:hypothetical protein